VSCKILFETERRTNTLLVSPPAHHPAFALELGRICSDGVIIVVTELMVSIILLLH
jgi:hypothetical protein